MKLDVRGRPSEAEAGGEEGDAVQHRSLGGVCVLGAVVGLALGLAPGVYLAKSRSGSSFFDPKAEL